MMETTAATTPEKEEEEEDNAWLREQQLGSDTGTFLVELPVPATAIPIPVATARRRPRLISFAPLPEREATTSPCMHLALYTAHPRDSSAASSFASTWARLQVSPSTTAAPSSASQISLSSVFSVAFDFRFDKEREKEFDG